MLETMVRLTREHTEALTRLAGSQQIVATEVAEAAVNRIEIAKTLALVAERLERSEEERRTRLELAMTDLKAHISAEMEMMTTATAAAIKSTATPRLIGWLITGACVVIAAALGAMVVSGRPHP